MITDFGMLAGGVAVRRAVISLPYWLTVGQICFAYVTKCSPAAVSCSLLAHMLLIYPALLLLCSFLMELAVLQRMRHKQI